MFRFTGTPALYIECDVRMCHGKCPVSIYIINKILRGNGWKTFPDNIFICAFLYLHKFVFQKALMPLLYPDSFSIFE